MQYKWNWGVIFADPYFGWLISGALNTLAIGALAWLIAFSVGALVGIGRTAPNRTVRIVTTTYVEVFRNIPLLVQVFLWFFVLPEVLPSDWGKWLKRDLPHPEFCTAVVALGLFSATRVAEQVRAGIQAIPFDQSRAALATGLTHWQVYRFIIIPRTFRSIIPTLTSETLNILKNSSIALVIGVAEITAQARQIDNYTFQGFEAFTASTALYLTICLIVAMGCRSVESRYRMPGMIGNNSGATA
ncbi:amino acid ABC transporter permease [Pseudomonas syringae]|uniref:Glutamate ABC transporter permease n=1 Tax=Pseudomonas syringae TaxID=317 RepID=A0A085V8I3_PSESX|nr:amino acid ABC transporter permease [Pseudomonas syringae]KFE51746.1 glutamate ABC transporter permease [Pseudomonas syringae]